MRQELSVPKPYVLHDRFPCVFRIVKSSHQRCSVETGVFKNFTKFTGKGKFCKMLKNTFFAEHLRATASKLFISLRFTVFDYIWTGKGFLKNITNPCIKHKRLLNFARREFLRVLVIGLQDILGSDTHLN